jgi:hypothetical protein
VISLEESILLIHKKLKHEVGKRVQVTMFLGEKKLFYDANTHKLNKEQNKAEDSG